MQGSGEFRVQGLGPLADLIRGPQVARNPGTPSKKGRLLNGNYTNNRLKGDESASYEAANAEPKIRVQGLWLGLGV